MKNAKNLLNSTANLLGALPEIIFMADYAVYVGRFAPFHEGHAEVVRDALKKVKHVIMLYGSANCPSDTRNPFPAHVRRNMIIAALRREYREGRITIAPVNDHTYHNGAWAAEVIRRVKAILERRGDEDATVGLVGFRKDETSDYLEWFPEWKSLVVTKQFGTVNASDIRIPYIETGIIHDADLHPGVVSILKRWKRTAGYRRVRIELAEINHVQKTYGPGPFLTSDAIIEHRGKLLAIVRGGKFGNGLLAFPGGINDGEDPLDCMFRELDEEVQIFKLNPWLTPELLKSFIVHREVFADPRRDARGHYIAHAFHIVIPEELPVPVVAGDDDAAKAHFIDFAMFKAKKVFADHYHVLRKVQRIKRGEEAPVPYAMAA